MLFRVFISLIAISAVASFGFGFWLVLRPQDHHWEIDIPLDKKLPPKTRAPDVRVPDPAANLRIDTDTDRPTVAPPISAESLIEAMEPGASEAAAVGVPPLSLSLPIACDPGEDCWIVNYVDLDPSEGRIDFRCNEMTYDGHKGTDFALANDARVADNVPVLSAAAGKVVGARDGEPDSGAAGMQNARDAGRECGNGVRIDHGDGWATQYCHMRKGSVLVQAGQIVEAGQILGAVGLSGLTEFPHVHVSVSRGGEVVDPFRGVAGGANCSLGDQPLWDDETLDRLLAKGLPQLIDAGFSDSVPTVQEAEKGEAAHDRFGSQAEAVVVWFRAIGIKPGDEATITALKPDGSPAFEFPLAFENQNLMMFQARGIKNNPQKYPNGLPPGTWTGRIAVKRDGKVTDEREITIPVFAGSGDG